MKREEAIIIEELLNSLEEYMNIEDVRPLKIDNLVSADNRLYTAMTKTRQLLAALSPAPIPVEELKADKEYMLTMRVKTALGHDNHIMLGYGDDDSLQGPEKLKLCRTCLAYVTPCGAESWGAETVEYLRADLVTSPDRIREIVEASEYARRLIKYDDPDTNINTASDMLDSALEGLGVR